MSYGLYLLTGAISDMVTNYQHYFDLILETSRPKLQCEIKCDEHICRLAEKMIEWERKFHYFELDYNPNVYDIMKRYKDNPALQR